MKLLSTIAWGALLSFPAVAMATDLAPLDVPAKALPAPTADISPGMQVFVGAPLNPSWNKLWKTGEEARAFADGQAADTVKTIPALLARQHVKSEASTIDGVRVHILTPDDIPRRTRTRFSSTFMAAVMCCSLGNPAHPRASSWRETDTTK